MAYGNHGFYDAENSQENQKRQYQQQLQAQEMERRRQEQMHYDRQRQAFQEQVISQEQARKQQDTANQFNLGMAAANSKKDVVDSMVKGGVFNAFSPIKQSLMY